MRCTDGSTDSDIQEQGATYSAPETTTGGHESPPAKKVCPEQSERSGHSIHAAFGTQVVLGIATVLTGVALWLAVLHQLVGALLVAATAWGAHGVGQDRKRRA